MSEVFLRIRRQSWDPVGKLRSGAVASAVGEQCRQSLDEGLESGVCDAMIEAIDA